MRIGVRRLLVVLGVVAAGLVPPPAEAAGYCSGSGVNVVVDFGALGDGIQKGCDASGNRSAAQAFENTGHHLTYASNQPGFVCRVDGVPAADPCVNTSPANAYWGLYWSDGTSGWRYASVAVGSLTVPAGATVALSWQNGGDADPPGTAPASAPAPPPAPASSTTPTSAPTRPRATTTTRAPAAVSTQGSATPSPTPTPSPSVTASLTASAGASAATSPSATTVPTPSASTSTAAAAGPVKATSATSGDSGGGLPWWVPIGAILVLAGLGGGVWRVRRARS